MFASQAGVDNRRHPNLGAVRGVQVIMAYTAVVSELGGSPMCLPSRLARTKSLTIRTGHYDNRPWGPGVHHEYSFGLRIGRLTNVFAVRVGSGKVHRLPNWVPRQQPAGSRGPTRIQCWPPNRAAHQCVCRPGRCGYKCRGARTVTCLHTRAWPFEGSGIKESTLYSVRLGPRAPLLSRPWGSLPDGGG